MTSSFCFDVIGMAKRMSVIRSHVQVKGKLIRRWHHPAIEIDSMEMLAISDFTGSLRFYLSMSTEPRGDPRSIRKALLCYIHGLQSHVLDRTRSPSTLRYTK